MRLLLDTHVLIWTLQNSLPQPMREAIGHPQAQTYVSFVSLWEIEIKKSLGKLQTPDDLYASLEQSNAVMLPISLAHIRHVATLPHHHGDPFDRMLIAQAQVEGLTLITHDKEFSRYHVTLL